MIDASECVVIGSGALGSSIAFHLVKAGKQVALVDKHALGSQTSPRAAGLTSQARSTDLMTQLAKRAVRKIEGFMRKPAKRLYSTSLARENCSIAGPCGTTQARGGTRAPLRNRC
jgi:glycine/D-amino acid oxidase-like deaminating enzyme